MEESTGEEEKFFIGYCTHCKATVVLIDKSEVLYKIYKNSWITVTEALSGLCCPLTKIEGPEDSGIRSVLLPESHLIEIPERLDVVLEDLKSC